MMATAIETARKTFGLPMIILRPGEKILETVSRHWSRIQNVPMLPLIAIAAFVALRQYAHFTFFGYAWQVLGLILIGSAAYVGTAIFVWKRNVLIVTNQRVIRHDQHGLFNKTVTELLYQDVADISFRKKGMSALMGGFGTIIIRTLGERKLVFDRVPNPERVVEQINQVRLGNRSPGPQPDESLTKSDEGHNAHLL